VAATADMDTIFRVNGQGKVGNFEIGEGNLKK